MKRLTKAVAAIADPLPEHWHRRKDDQGNTFYWNSVTMTSLYERPKPLPAGWRERIDPATGMLYHYNVYSRETRLPPDTNAPPPPPLPLPPGRTASFSRSNSAGLHSVPPIPGLPALQTARAAALNDVPVQHEAFSLLERSFSRAASARSHDRSIVRSIARSLVARWLVAR